ncbi:hypothetical protein D3C77_497050 [compost metagenome]
MHLVAQLIDAERFADQVCALGYVEVVTIATGKQDRQQRSGFPCLERQLFTVHVRQADIGHHQRQRLLRILEDLQGALSVLGLDDRIAQRFQHFDDQHAHDRVIFDNQKGGGR